MGNIAFVLAGLRRSLDYLDLEVLQQITAARGERVEDGGREISIKEKRDWLMKRDKGPGRDSTAGSCGRTRMWGFCWIPLTHLNLKSHSAVCTSGLSCPHLPLARAHAFLPSVWEPSTGKPWRVKSVSLYKTFHNRAHVSPPPREAGTVGMGHAAPGTALENKGGTERSVGVIISHLWVQIFGKSMEGFGKAGGDEADWLKPCVCSLRCWGSLALHLCGCLQRR